MTRYLLFIFIILSFSKKSTSQTKLLDSVYINKLDYYKHNNSDSTLFYVKKSKLSKNEVTILKALSVEAYVYHRQKKYKKSEKIAKQLLELSNHYLKISNQKEITLNKIKSYYAGKISALNRLFWIKKNQENYKKAYEFLVQYYKQNQKYSFLTPFSSF